MVKECLISQPIFNFLFGSFTKKLIGKKWSENEVSAIVQAEQVQ